MARSEQLAVLLGKSLVCLGLLCSDDAVDVQNRITDRGGVSVLVSALNVALAMCSTTYHSVGIGAGAGAGKGASAGGKEVSTGLSSEVWAVRLKQSALVCKWACWCLFVSHRCDYFVLFFHNFHDSTIHFLFQFELFTYIVAAHLFLSTSFISNFLFCLQNLTLNHPPSKAVFFHSSCMRPLVDVLKLHPESAHVHRQGLALLFNLIAPDPYAKYRYVTL